MKLNINENVTVYLTEKGLEILKEEDSVSYQCNYDEKRNVLKTQLWILMQTFGKYMRMGQVPLFDKNDIIIGDD